MRTADSRSRCDATIRRAPFAMCGLNDDNTPPASPGFGVDAVPLPARPRGLSDSARDQLAIIVIRLQRGDTPVDIVSRPSIEAWRVFDEDELEREEAREHVDIFTSAAAALASDGGRG